FGPAALPWIAGGPVGRLNAALAAAGPISFDSLPLVDLLLFAPAGFLFVMLLRERGREAGWVGVAGAGAGLALLAELGHGMLGFPIWWGAVLVRMAGVGLGAWAAQRALPALTPVLLERGHAVIVERTFDVTNALVACAGLGIGWIVVRRSGFAPYGEALAAPVAR